MSKSPGNPIGSFEDFLGNTIEVGTHVLVIMRYGDVPQVYSGVVLDINEVPSQWSNKSDIKAQVEPTGMYSVGRSHEWPLHSTRDPFTNKYERTGQRPKPNWILKKNVVKSPTEIV